MRHLLATGNVDEVVAFLQEVLGQKHETHYLHEGKTGATKHLAMLGGQLIDATLKENVGQNKYIE